LGEVVNAILSANDPTTCTERLVESLVACIIMRGQPVNDLELLTYKNAGNIGLLDLLPLSRGRVLDCGCGAGDNARILSARGWRVTAVTIDPREKKAAEEFCEAVYIADLDYGISPEVGTGFDVILASHVLEHLANPERFLYQARERLNPLGVLAVALPNIAHYSQRISFSRGRFEYTDSGQLDRTHLRFYTYWTARGLLERNGYRLINVKVEGALPWWKSRRLVSAGLLRSIDNRVVPRYPNLLGHQTLLIARPTSATDDH